jgi:hypothetical protein
MLADDFLTVNGKCVSIAHLRKRSSVQMNEN